MPDAYCSSVAIGKLLTASADRMGRQTTCNWADWFAANRHWHIKTCLPAGPTCDRHPSFMMRVALMDIHHREVEPPVCCSGCISSALRPRQRLVDVAALVLLSVSVPEAPELIRLLLQCHHVHGFAHGMCDCLHCPDGCLDGAHQMIIKQIE